MITPEVKNKVRSNIKPTAKKLLTELKSIMVIIEKNQLLHEQWVLDFEDELNKLSVLF